jgi:hypothetical protein
MSKERWRELGSNVVKYLFITVAVLFPVTFLHEVGHYIVCKIYLVPVVEFIVTPWYCYIRCETETPNSLFFYSFGAGLVLIILVPLVAFLRGKIPSFLFFALLANIVGQVILLIVETSFHTQYILSLGNFVWTLIFLLIVLTFGLLLVFQNFRNTSDL